MWIPARERRNYTAMTNGILDIDAVLANRSDYLLPATPYWFSMVSLPYGFDPKATCPMWWDYLRYNLEEDPERIARAQEWVGYCLTASTKYQAFLLCEGDGGNGKSVFIAGITAIIDPCNVSGIAVENFADRFQRTNMVGKLMNASADCGEIDRFAEGFIKACVSGDRMFFDRKGKEGLNCVPTAKLMIACNTLPHIHDRTDGVYRRMLPLPFRIKVAEDRIIRGMDSIEFWQKSGELPGMFNWALEGLARLNRQGGFTRSSVGDQALDRYRKENNPAKVFLEEACEPTSFGSGKIICKELYGCYTKWCKESGINHALSEMNFGKEVRRSFPQAKRERENRENRTWIYTGINYQNGFQAEITNRQDF